MVMSQRKYDTLWWSDCLNCLLSYSACLGSQFFIKCAKIEGKTKVQTVILIFHTKCDKTKRTVHQNFLNDITACNLQILKNSRPPYQSEQNNEGKSKVTSFHAI